MKQLYENLLAMTLTELKVERSRSFGRPETQRVDVVVGVAGHRTVIRHGQHSLHASHQYTDIPFVISLLPFKKMHSLPLRLPFSRIQ